MQGQPAAEAHGGAVFPVTCHGMAEHFGGMHPYLVLAACFKAELSYAETAAFGRHTIPGHCPHSTVVLR